MSSTVEQEERLELLRDAFFAEEEFSGSGVYDFYDWLDEQAADTCDDPECVHCYDEDEADSSAEEDLTDAIFTGTTAAVDGLVAIIEEAAPDLAIQAANILLGYSLALTDRGLGA